MSNDLAGFTFGAVACAATLGTIIWRVISLKLASEILLLRHDLEKKDLQISNLQDVQVMLQNGSKEKFEHLLSRVKDDNLKIDKRLKHTENFLSKNTEFEVRE